MSSNKLDTARIRRRIGQSPFFQKTGCAQRAGLRDSVLEVLSALHDFENKNRDRLTPDLLRAVVRLTAATQGLLPNAMQPPEPRLPAGQPLSLESHSESRSESGPRLWTP